MKISLLLVTSSLAVATGIRPLPVISLTSAGQSKEKKSLDVKANVLGIPRGGANIGSVEPQTLVKAFCALAMVQGLVMNTGPKISNEQYGITGKANDSSAQYQASQFGSGVISISTLLYLLNFKGKSLAQANKAVYAICGYQQLRSWLSGAAAEQGSESGAKAGLAICVFGFLAMSQDWWDTALKALSVALALSGVQMIVDPEGTKKTWKSETAKLTPTSSLLLGLNGWYLLAQSAINLSMLFKGASPLEAAGYNAAVWAISHGYNVVTGKFKSLGMPDNPQIAWCLMHAVIAYAALA
ncbi:MAG: hypothetical protein SGILL_007524 [Bacillariaceae sp.]